MIVNHTSLQKHHLKHLKQQALPITSMEVSISDKTPLSFDYLFMYVPRIIIIWAGNAELFQFLKLINTILVQFNQI